MSDEPGPPTDDHADRDAVDVRPFAVAAVIFVIVGVLALVFLRDDEGLRVVHPETFERVDGSTIRAIAAQRSSGCEVIERVQVDLDDETVFVEFVVDDADDCVQGTRPLEAVVELPEPLAGRRLVGGPGRRALPCERGPSDLRCGPDR